MRNDNSRCIRVQRSRKTADCQNLRVFFNMISTMDTAIVAIGPTEVYCNRKGSLLNIY